MRRKRITEKRFIRVKEYLLKPKTILVYPSNKEVGEKFGFSDTTIARIRNSKDYEQFKNYNTMREVENMIERGNK